MIYKFYILCYIVKFKKQCEPTRQSTIADMFLKHFENKTFVQNNGQILLLTLKCDLDL